MPIVHPSHQGDNLKFESLMPNDEVLIAYPDTMLMTQKRKGKNTIRRFKEIPIY